VKLGTFFSLQLVVFGWLSAKFQVLSGVCLKWAEWLWWSRGALRPPASNWKKQLEEATGGPLLSGANRNRGSHLPKGATGTETVENAHFHVGGRRS